MAVNLGKDGCVRLSTIDMVHVNTWELSLAEDALETTAFGGGWDRTYVPGLRGVTATFSGYYEDTSTGGGTGWSTALSNLLSTGTPTTVEAQLFYSVGATGNRNGYGGTAIITGITIGAPIEGLQAISANLQFDGGVHTTIVL